MSSDVVADVLPIEDKILVELLVFYHIVEAEENKQLNISPHPKVCYCSVLLHASVLQLSPFTKWANIFRHISVSDLTHALTWF